MPWRTIRVDLEESMPHSEQLHEMPSWWISGLVGGSISPRFGSALFVLGREVHRPHLEDDLGFDDRETGFVLEVC